MSRVRAEHLLGIYDQGLPGPLFLLFGGIHGNESAGVEAIALLLEALRARQLPFRGRLVAIRGNVRAGERGERYLDRDLNRLWTRNEIARIEGTAETELCSEERELLEILELVRDELGERGASCDELHCLDLHTSSADGAPFSCMADTLRNRKLAFAFPVPAILGLEETLDGAMLDMFYEMGAIAVAFEGGRHDGVDTVRNLESACWIALVAARCLAESELAEYSESYARLRSAASGIPRVMEVLHREVLVEGDAFQMMPGFSSFDRVARGTALAVKNGNTLTTPRPSILLLPLYQGQGSDGYFLGRSVSPFWLALSAKLRYFGFDGLLRYLPGVDAHPKLTDAWRVNPRIARFLVTQFFHLLGYRRRRPEKGALVFTRRPEHR